MINSLERDPQKARDQLLEAIQEYAEAWKNNKVTIFSHPSRTNVIIALDCLEFAIHDNTLENIKKDLNEELQR
jgi:phosphosulfolactate phosphohydrolase-like enzyme